jgi:hypothetical protein
MYILQLLLESIFFCAIGKVEIAKAPLRAVSWNLSKFKSTMNERKKVQGYRVINDSELFKFMLKRSEKIRSFFDFIKYRKTEKWEGFF